MTLAKFATTPLGKQVGRFARLFVGTLLPQLVAFQGNYGRSAIIAAVVASAEVAYRQVFP